MDCFIDNNLNVVKFRKNSQYFPRTKSKTVRPFWFTAKGSRQKKLFFLVVRTLRPLPPPPLGLVAIRNLGLVAGPLKKELFFAASLMEHSFADFCYQNSRISNCNEFTQKGDKKNNEYEYITVNL